MPNNVGLEFASRTDTGRVRAQNEDAVAVSPAHGFAILADGMGGYNAGEVASHIAITVTRAGLEEGLRSRRGAARLHRSKYLQQLVDDSIQRANSAILEAARAERQYSGMGTTLVVALFHHDKMTAAHVGDSRAYRLRQGELSQITRDHSLVQEQIDAGLVDPESAPYSQNRNLVTRAVGVDVEMEVEIHDHQIEAGDLYLLCSDGLSDMLMEQEIADVLMAHRESLHAACDALVQRANDNGGRDNISVILIRVHSIRTEAGGLLERILNWVA